MSNWQRVVLLGIVATVAIAELACRTRATRPSDPAGVFCIGNDDCTDGLTCMRVAVDASVCAAPCGVGNWTCPGSLVCFVPGDVSGWCGHPCKNDAPCPAGLACNAREVCEPVECKPTQVPSGCCATTDDCTAGERCYRAGCTAEPGRCLRLSSRACWADSDCPRGTRCEGAVIHTFECPSATTADERPGACLE